MHPIERDDRPVEQPTYERPKVTDYGTLQELTESGGSVSPTDVPHGHPSSAYPLS
ncbi:MAG TPA: lasso RiPP family leader peptide-containing protein [Solirubrobacteraceae bacterium]|nr:lasso RiPP family leader peptide-containing protein [Solirubrobacteraceae bacterium]